MIGVIFTIVVIGGVGGSYELFKVRVALIVGGLGDNWFSFYPFPQHHPYGKI